MTGVTVRPAEPVDVPAIGAIFAPYVTGSVASFHQDPPSDADWRARLLEARRTGHPCLVAESGGRVVGFAFSGSWRSKAAYRSTVEVTVYVEEGATGRGIGRALVEDLVVRCSAAGFEQMLAVVTAGVGDSSEGFFVASGFDRVGLLPEVGFKFGRRLDIALLQRSLRPGGEV